MNMESCCNSFRKISLAQKNCPGYFNYGFSVRNTKICFLNTHQFGIDYVLKIKNGNIEMMCYFVTIRCDDKLSEQNIKHVEYNDSLTNSILAINTLYNYFKEIESNHHFYQHLVHNFTIEKTSKNSLLYKHFKKCFNFDPFMCYNFRMGLLINAEINKHFYENSNFLSTSQQSPCSKSLTKENVFIAYDEFGNGYRIFIKVQVMDTKDMYSVYQLDDFYFCQEILVWSDCDNFIIYNEKHMQEIDLEKLQFEKNDMYSIDCDLLDYDGFLKFEYESLDVINPTLIFSCR